MSRELLECFVSGPRVGERAGVHFRAAEVPRDPVAQHETMMCASRQAIVVTGAGTGSGDAKSIVHSPEPPDIGAVEVPRGRMLQQPRTGSQKYSS